VRLGEEDVLRDDLEVVPADLPEAFQGDALRVDVDHFPTGAHDVPRELQAEVRLAAPRLAMEEGDAAFLDPPAQEVVEDPAAQGHRHLPREPPSSRSSVERSAGRLDMYAPSGVHTTTPLGPAVRGAGR